jgi:hypothetical protein
MLIGLTGSCQHAFRNESLAQFVTQLHLFHNLTSPTTAQWGVKLLGKDDASGYLVLIGIALRLLVV